MLLCAVASSRWVRGSAVRMTSDIARHAVEQCSIGFQPVSGRAARYPRMCVVHGTGTAPFGAIDRPEESLT
jgi:hypothetical protein